MKPENQSIAASEQAKPVPVLFIDRDGTLIVEPPVTEQVDSFEQLEFLPRVIQNLAFIRQKLDYDLVIVSNQDGLGTPNYPMERFTAINDLMLRVFRTEGVEFDDMYFDPHRASDNHPNRKPGTGMLQKFIEGNGNKYDLAHSYVIAAPWEVDLSTDIQYNSLDSDSYQAVYPRRTTFTGVLATRLAWERFRSEAHVVYMGAWDRFNPAGGNPWARENSFRGAWMPGISAGWYPSDGASVTAYAKRSYRLPSFNDLYYTQVGNSNLKPEEAFQIGVDARFGRGWSLRISPYYNRVSNKIVAIPTVSQFRWTMLNIGLADIVGIDSSVEGALKRGDWELGGTLRYTYQLALDHSDSQNYGNQIPYIPRHSGSIDINARWKNWSINWNTALTGERWSRSANTPDYYIEPWSTSDASLSWTTGQVFTLTLSVNNIFNRQYEIVQGYPMPGTSVMLCATVTL